MTPTSSTTSPLDRPVFVVRDGIIIETTPRAESGYIDETTTPNGVGPRFHLRRGVRFVVDGKEFSAQRDARDYAAEISEPVQEEPTHELWSWGLSGQCPVLVAAFDSEAEAQIALDETFLYDFWHCDRIEAYPTREAAEAAMADSQEPA